MLRKLLINAYEQKKIVDINIYEAEEGESLIGYITNISDEHFVIKEVDKFGNSNGSTTYAIDKIKNGNYIQVYIDLDKT
jgi:ribosomal protein S6